MPTPEQIISKVNSKIIINDYFFAHILLNLIPQEQHCKKMRFDGRHLGFNLEWLQQSDPDEIEGVVNEGLLHLALGHPWRRAGREKETWNRAADQVVWNALRSAGRSLPRDVREKIRPEFDGKSVEEVYQIMQAEPKIDDPRGGEGKEPQGGEPGQSPKGKGKGKGKGQPKKKKGDDGAQGKQDEQQEDDQQQGDQQDQQQQKQQQPQEPDYGDSEVADPAPEDFNETEAEMKRIVSQAMNFGSAPGYLKRIIKEALKDIVDWRAITLRWCQQRAAEDYTWQQPNKRYLPSGLYLPSERSEKMGTLVIANDASGSVWGVQEEFAGAMTAILREVRPEITHVIYFDTRIVKHEEYTADDQISFERRGGGGTSFEPIFEWIEREGIEPAGLIVLTDLEGSFPQQAPNYPVLWATTIKHEAPFGEVVKVSLEEIRKS